jgi:hypothetical protein
MTRNPITARDVEHLLSQDGTIATRSSVAKRSNAPLPVHGQSYHVKDSLLYQSVSATQVAAALAGDKLPTDPPVIGKTLRPVSVTPGMRNRTSPGSEAAHAELGRAIWDAALATAPSDHPAKLSRNGE